MIHPVFYRLGQSFISERELNDSISKPYKDAR